ncbi:MAG: hypothetical protein IT462_13370 [Planctomycetes bacterium]|nr:hypothetical protein [Planctomycetota bacterium]
MLKERIVMRNTFFAAMFAFAILGTQSLSAFPAVTGGEAQTGLICACCRPQPSRVYSIEISGEMKDADTIKKVEDLLKTIAGVSDVTIDGKIATITMKRRSEMTQEAVEKALKDSGHGVTKFEEVPVDY